MRKKSSSADAKQTNLQIGSECPLCSAELIERQGQQRPSPHTRLLVCTRYPRCRFSKSIAIGANERLKFHLTHFSNKKQAS